MSFKVVAKLPIQLPKYFRNKSLQGVAGWGPGRLDRKVEGQCSQCREDPEELEDTGLRAVWVRGTGQPEKGGSCWGSREELEKTTCHTGGRCFPASRLQRGFQELLGLGEKCEVKR